MSKEKKNMIVPQLRFPEYKNEEEWNEKRLDEACEVNPAIEKLPEDFVYIDLESVEAGILLQKKNIQFSSAPSRAQRLLKDGDIIFQMVRPYQMNNLFFTPDDNQNYVASTGYAQLRAFESKMYLFQYLHTQHFVARVLAKCTGSNYPAINSGDLSGIKIEIPKLHSEQQKIASCLSSLDDLISAHTQKLEALKAHKKGLMQQLFPAEGATIPKLRFEEFKDSGEWEEKTLDELGGLVNGLTYSPDDIRDCGLLVLRSSNIQNGRIVLDDNVYVRTDIKGANLSKANDILICVRNGSKSLIGKNALIPQVMPLCTHGAFMTVFRAHFPFFIFQLFQTRAYDKQVAGDLGATINSINGSNFIKYKFWVPKNPDEQQKIANCLSSLDELLTAQAEMIVHLKLHKKGLMQGLFPVVKENN